MVAAIAFGIFQPFGQTVMNTDGPQISEIQNEAVSLELRDGHDFTGQYSETERHRKLSVDTSGTRRFGSIRMPCVDSDGLMLRTRVWQDRIEELYGKMNHPASSPARWRC